MLPEVYNKNDSYYLMIIELSGFNDLQKNVISEKIKNLYDETACDIPSAYYLDIINNKISSDITTLSTWFNCLDNNGNAVTNFFDENDNISGLASGEVLYLSSCFEKDKNNGDSQFSDGISDLLANLTLSSSNIGFRYYPGVFKGSQTITPGQPQDVTHDLEYKEFDPKDLFDD